MTGSDTEIPHIDDPELAMPLFGAQEFSDLLEQRLHIGFTVPNFSYPSRPETWSPMSQGD